MEHTKESLVAEFKALVKDAPSRQHPWVRAVEDGALTKEQIVQGELQHYLSVTSRAKIYATTLWKAIRQSDAEITKFAAEAVREELANEPTHADVLYQFFAENGISKEDALNTPPTPGTKDGMQQLNDQLEPLSAIECIAVMALPEWEYGGEDGIAATIGKAYERLGFSSRARGTFSLHSEVDAQHGDAYLGICAEKILSNPSLKSPLMSAMILGRDAFLHERDGQYQAASGDMTFKWRGLK